MVKKIWLLMAILPTISFAAPDKTLARVFTGLVDYRTSVGAMVEKNTGKVLTFAQAMTTAPSQLDRSCWYLIDYGWLGGKLTLFNVKDIDDCGHDFGQDK